MAERNEHEELVEYLRSAGHSPSDIDKILIRVHEYERQTQHDSIMESIGSGSLNLQALIKEALGE